MMRKIIIIFLIFLSIKGFSQKNVIGNTPPPIKTGLWVRGKRLNTFQSGRVYVINFWSTWCAPCQDALPYLSKLSQKYPTVKFIGINVLENNTNSVLPFIKLQKPKLRYDIAIDFQQTDTSKKGFMSVNWVDTLDLKGVPMNVIIGKAGQIEWIGTPMNTESALEKIVNGVWDLNSYKNQLVAKPQLELMRMKLGSAPNWQSIYSKLKDEYSYLSADSVMLSWKVEYYYSKSEFNEYINSLIEYYSKYDSKTNPARMNSVAWDVFKLSDDKPTLTLAASWVSAEFENKYPTIRLDTYANLLYKLGNIKKAIEAEKRTLKHLKDSRNISTVAISYYKMLVGQPTWPHKNSYSEFHNQPAAWKRVKRALKEYSSFQADSIITYAKIKYAEKRNWADYCQNIINYIDGFATSIKIIDLNNYAFEIFLYSKNKEELLRALKWSAITIKDQNSPKDIHGYFDTYANILYKLGRKDEALIAMKKAVQLSPESEKKEYNLTLSKIEQGLSTWNVGVK